MCIIDWIKFIVVWLAELPAYPYIMCMTDWVKFILVWLSLNELHIPYTRTTGWIKFILIWLGKWTAYPIYMHDWLDEMHTCMTPSLNELHARLIGSSSHLYDSLIEWTAYSIYMHDWFWSSSHLYDSLIEWTAYACTTGWIKFILVWLIQWSACPIYMHDWLDQVHICMTDWMNRTSHTHAGLVGPNSYLYDWLNELPIRYTCTGGWIKFIHTCLADWSNCIIILHVRVRYWLSQPPFTQGSSRTNLILEHVRTPLTGWTPRMHDRRILLLHSSMAQSNADYWSAASFWPVVTPEEISRCSIILWEASLVSQNWFFRPFS